MTWLSVRNPVIFPSTSRAQKMLFNHLSLSSGIKSPIITYNQSFDKWQDIFDKDTVLTAALLDRLTHKAYLSNGKIQKMAKKKRMGDKPLVIYVRFWEE